jgi:hypothetical protein
MKGSTQPHYFLVLAFTLLFCSCAQIPRESVELSTTVGRDISTMHQSHLNLANALFSRMKQDVNRFVDNVYAPFQIQFILAKQKERQAAGDENNLFSVLENAARNPQNAQAQKDTVLVMQAIVEAIHTDVEDYRSTRLAPILQQEQEVISQIELVYDQIEKGNAAVTAHLASVIKVHEAQDELLQKVNLEGLRQKIGVRLGITSEKLNVFANKAKKVEGSIDKAAETIEGWTKELDKIIQGD